MGKPYADDLRLVAVRLIEEGHTRPEVAELCGISVSSVFRFVRRYRATGSVSPDKFGGYKDYALAKYANRIKRWIAKRPDLTLLELQARLAMTGVTVAASSVFRFLRHLGLTYKKSAARGRAGSPGRGRHAPALAAKPAQARSQAAGFHR
jgi:transposase